MVVEAYPETFMQPSYQVLCISSIWVRFQTPLPHLPLKYPAQRSTGRSFHIGAATTASRCQLQDALIKILGHWESTAYMSYIQTPPETLYAVARTLTGKTSRIFAVRVCQQGFCCQVMCFCCQTT